MNSGLYRWRGTARPARRLAIDRLQDDRLGPDSLSFAACELKSMSARL
jgi:hypothetical protein